MRVRDIEEKRKQLALQFQQECFRLQMKIVRMSGNFLFVIHDNGREYRALILPTTFDYYEYRLNVGKVRVDMLIVERHNAVVPITVTSLQDVTTWEPLAAPDLGRESRAKNNKDDAHLLLSKYILNFEGAYEELARMNPRSRRRYNQRRAQYLKKKRGRPLAG